MQDLIEFLQDQSNKCEIVEFADTIIPVSNLSEINEDLINLCIDLNMKLNFFDLNKQILEISDHKFSNPIEISILQVMKEQGSEISLMRAENKEYLSLSPINKELDDKISILRKLIMNSIKIINKKSGISQSGLQKIHEKVDLLKRLSKKNWSFESDLINLKVNNSIIEEKKAVKEEIKLNNSMLKAENPSQQKNVIPEKNNEGKVFRSQSPIKKVTFIDNNPKKGSDSFNFPEVIVTNENLKKQPVQQRDYIPDTSNLSGIPRPNLFPQIIESNVNSKKNEVPARDIKKKNAPSRSPNKIEPNIPVYSDPSLSYSDSICSSCQNSYDQSISPEIYLSCKCALDFDCIMISLIMSKCIKCGEEIPEQERERLAIYF